MSGDVAKERTGSSTTPCPRCEGQKYDRGSCGLCRNSGLLNENGEAIASDLIGPSVARVRSSHPDDTERAPTAVDDTPALCDFLGSGGGAHEVENARIAARDTEI